MTATDYTDATQTVRAAADIIADAARRGLPASPALHHAAKAWIDAVDTHITDMSPADALTVIVHYDILHRIARGTAAPADTLNRHILAAFRAMTHGDTTVDQYTHFRAISDALNRRRDPAYLGAPLQWYSTTLARWHSQLSPRSKAAAPANSGEAASDGEATQPNRSGEAAPTDYDTARRIDLLLHEDLTAFEGTNQPAYKSHLQKRHNINLR